MKQSAPRLVFPGMLRVADDSGHPLAAAFTRFIGETAFPCVGAKAAVNRGGMRFVVARDFRSAWDDLRILPTLMDLAKDYRATPGLFRSPATGSKFRGREAPSRAPPACPTFSLRPSASRSGASSFESISMTSEGEQCSANFACSPDRASTASTRRSSTNNWARNGGPRRFVGYRNNPKRRHNLSNICPPERRLGGQGQQRLVIFD